MESLPSHRQFLTTLVDSLSQTSTTTTQEAGSFSSSSHSTSTLNAAPPNQRRLLLTLHVLFPNLLLPALDLLDRGLVTRLRLISEAGAAGDKAAADHHDDAEDTEKSTAELKDNDGELEGTFIVKSLATTLTRRDRDVPLGSRRYLVHLRSWNCSCAGFAVEAFPASAATEISHRSGTNEEGPEGPGLDWSFGGRSLDGLAFTGDVPCCKHLLACLLIERWSDVVGRHAEERVVTKGEMAGTVADL